MQCPSCLAELRMVVEGTVEIDVCDRCDSVWLDPGELNAITEPADSELGHPVMTLRKEGNLRCPRCETRDFCDMAFDSAAVARCNGCGGIHVSVDALDRLSQGITQVEVDHTAKNSFASPQPTDDAQQETAELGVVTHTVLDTAAHGILEMLVSVIFHV